MSSFWTTTYLISVSSWPLESSTDPVIYAYPISNAGHADQNTTQTHVQTLKTLSDACIHAARHNHSLIVGEWTNGSLPIIGYFYAHYIFSAALITARSREPQ